MADCTFDFAIVGGGFPGIYTAWRLKQLGYNVALIELSSSLGGILNSLRWKDYYVDIGVQNFDLRSSQEKTFYQSILKNNLSVLPQHSWASILGDFSSPLFEMLDFEKFDPNLCDASLIQLEIIRSKNNIPLSNSSHKLDFKTFLINKFGSLLGEKIAMISEKFTGKSASLLSDNATKDLQLFSRVKLGSDEKMASLKHSTEFYNDRLAVSLNHDDPLFHPLGINRDYGYPKYGGMKSFCSQALNALKDNEVQVLLSSKIISIDVHDEHNCNLIIDTKGTISTLNTTKVIWTLGKNSLSKLLDPLNLDENKITCNSSILLIAFEMSSEFFSSFDYIHDFDVSRIPYRTGLLGKMSNQVKSNGSTFILAEVILDDKKLKLYNTNKSQFAKKVYQDVRNSGIIVSNAPTFIDFEAWLFKDARKLSSIDQNDLLNSKKTDAYGTMFHVTPSSLHARGAYISYFENNLVPLFYSNSL